MEDFVINYLNQISLSNTPLYVLGFLLIVMVGFFISLKTASRKNKLLAFIDRERVKKNFYFHGVNYAEKIIQKQLSNKAENIDLGDLTLSPDKVDFNGTKNSLGINVQSINGIKPIKLKFTWSYMLLVNLLILFFASILWLIMGEYSVIFSFILLVSANLMCIPVFTGIDWIELQYGDNGAIKMVYFQDATNKPIRNYKDVASMFFFLGQPMHRGILGGTQRIYEALKQIRQG